MESLNSSQFLFMKCSIVKCTEKFQPIPRLSWRNACWKPFMVGRKHIGFLGSMQFSGCAFHGGTQAYQAFGKHAALSVWLP